MNSLSTDNYRKHTHQNPVQKFLIERFYSEFLREIELLGPKSILDVGCGEGFTLERIRKLHIGEKLEGIDFLKTAIDIGKKIHPDVTLREASAYDLPYKDNLFDVLLCSEVLEHLEDPEKALAEIQRVTKKYAVLSVPNEPIFMISNFVRGKNWSRWGNDIEHINHWSTGAFQKFVSTKFNVIKVKQPFPWTLLVAEKKG
jgi:ubiquinone/menaquinone biosynthesis C-methylase UbiE